MTETRQAERTLRSALQECAQANTDAKQAHAILSLQDGLDSAFRAYLARLGVADIDSLPVGYPALVNLVRDQTGLFAGDPLLPALLVSLNNTRNKIAHPSLGKPTAGELDRDLDQYVKVIRRFWPVIFREPFPEALLATGATPQPRPEPVPAPQRKPPPEPSPDRGPPRPPRWPRIKRFLRQVWSEETAPRLQKRLLLKRVAGIVVFLILAKLLKDAALFTARWPAPVKYGGIVLFLLAVALYAWSLILAWKVLRQIRLKGVLISLAVSYIVLLGAVLLTSTSSLPWGQLAWQTTRDWASMGSRAIADAAGSVISAPGDFRVAYLGHRRPVRIPGIDADDPTYLTPIPANRPATLAATAEPISLPGLPTPESAAAPGDEGSSSLPLPDCPHAQARLTAPLVGQVVEGQVEIEGTANIENFDYYKFEYRREGDAENAWHWIASFETAVDAGLLGTWDVSGLSPDLYSLRLTVVNMEGNYPYTPCKVTVQVR